MYAVSSDYNNVIYSGEAQHTLSLLFNNVEYPNANTKVEYVKVKSNIISNGDERFCLNNFVSKEVEIKIHDIDLEDIIEPVEISIGTLVNGSYEYVPIGIFNISENPTKDDNVTTIKLRDNSVKFDVPYNAENVIQNNNGEATMFQILDDICTTCGVTLATTTFINDDTKVSVWDNTVTARQYVMYIAEKAGSIATISRDGELLLIPIDDNLDTFNLDSQLIESYTEGDMFIISRVVYEDAIRKFEYGTVSELTRNHTTLYISSENPYIVDTTEIENIYNSINGFSISGMKISKILGNPALDPYDLISFTYNNKTYVTFAQNILTYNGVITQSFDTNIGTLEKAQENVTINTEGARFKRVSTRIDQAEGNIEFITSEVRNNYYTIEQTNSLIQNAETGLTNTFSEAGGNNIFRNTGLWFSATTSEATLFPSDEVYPSSELFMGNKVAYEFWSGEVKRISNDKAVNMTSMLLLDDILSQEQIVPNGRYTISFKYKKLIQLANVQVKINDITTELTNTTDTEFETQIEVSSQHINIQFIADVDECCEIYDLMVNTGDVKLAYSQNQNETTTDTVNISKGITITSSDTDTIFKANSDGIRTLDRSGNELTKFTDTGMTTKKMTVEDTSQVVGILFQEVGDQTWLTRL